jgi:hypothetical protein
MKTPATYANRPLTALTLAAATVGLLISVPGATASTPPPCLVLTSLARPYHVALPESKRVLCWSDDRVPAPWWPGERRVENS